MPFASRLKHVHQTLILTGLLIFSVLFAAMPQAHAAEKQPTSFPLPLTAYGEAEAEQGLLDVIVSRIRAEPLNLVVTIIFLLAIIHTFMTPYFRKLAHDVEVAHLAKLAAQSKSTPTPSDDQQSDEGEYKEPEEVSFKGQVLHFFGEVEAVFGIWAFALVAVIAGFKDWSAAKNYLGYQVNFTEPMFVVVIMALASTRPILQFAERGLRAVASIGKGSVAAWWLSILIVAPLLGSLITEPAAMTIGAMLLGRQFYALKPPPRLAYATLGLLFVNISVGGTFTHFAAPPVLMVVGPWKWDLMHMLTNFGWRSLIGILVATTLYYLIFRKHFTALQAKKENLRRTTPNTGPTEAPVPLWITLVQVGFMAWTVYTAHYPPLFIGGFLVFLAFAQATAHHQSKLDLKAPMLVGFFLAGLVIHGGLQGWWIEPVLSRLSSVPLFFGTLALSPFNDNATMTYLATLVPNFSDELKYAVVAGAVTGGGLTVIANAPNPAGQSILSRYFPNGVSPLGLLIGALAPTAILAAAFILL